MKEYKLIINGNDYNVVVNDIEDTVAEVEVNGTPYKVEIDKPLKKVIAFNLPKPAPAPVSLEGTPVVAKPNTISTGTVKSPLPGVVLEVYVKVGDEVKSGQKLLVLEAMKMENTIEADRSGKVTEIHTDKGASVLEGAPLVTIG